MINHTLTKLRGVFHVRYREPIPGTSQTMRRQRSTRQRNPRLAKLEAAKIIAEVEAAQEGRKPSCTLAELGREWLDLNTHSVSHAHWQAMEIHLRLHFGTLLELDLKACSSTAVKEALNAFRATHAETSALTWRRYLRTLFGWAITSKRLQFIPWSQKDLGKMKAQQIPRPTLPMHLWAPWLDAVAAACGDPLDPRPRAVAMMLAAGLREMEVIRARWEWLNLDPQAPTYTPGLTKGGEADARALPQWLVDRLRPLKKAQGWMFPNPASGLPYHRGCCSRMIRAANTAVGTPGITHHRLRATVATLLLARVSPKDAQAALAHKDPRTTLIYNEEDPSAVRQALNQMGKLAGLGAL